MLVLCSRNAHDKNVLVRRPHVDQHGCPSRERERVSLEGGYEGRLDDLLCSCNARSQTPLARANGTSRRASGWAGEIVARSGRPSSPPSREKVEEWCIARRAQWRLCQLPRQNEFMGPE